MKSNRTRDNGLQTLLPLGRSLPAASTREASPRSEGATSTVSLGRTSSPASGDGTTPSSSPAGPMTSPCGPGPAPVSPSAAPEAREALPTRATFGPSGQGSFGSADLQSLLENKLVSLLEDNGSILYSMTWKRLATPAQRAILQRQALPRRTSAPASIGRPTPTVEDSASSARHGYMVTGHSGTTLLDAARLAGWATPVATEIGNTLENYQAMKANMRSGPRTAITHPSLQAQLAGWPSPQAQDGPKMHASLVAAENEAERKSWTNNLPVAALSTSGSRAISSPAGTEFPGPLNPAHSRWLMGFPIAWDACAPTVMPSSRKSRRRSSAP